MKTTWSLFCSIYMVIVSLSAFVTAIAYPGPAGAPWWMGPLAISGTAAVAAYNGARLIRKARRDEGL